MADFFFIFGKKIKIYISNSPLLSKKGNKSKSFFDECSFFMASLSNNNG